jgi:hypothetical protein
MLYLNVFFVVMKANIYESALAATTLLSIVGICFYFYEVINPSPVQDNPFRVFDTNPGIIKISVASLISRIIFIICFVILYASKYQSNKVVLAVYLLAALVVGFLQWFELYYGSTFYYGEVRDKQGLMFPVLASAMVTLIVWKVDYLKAKKQNLLVKLALVGLVNIGLYLLWIQVGEPWNLWQS